MRLEPRAWLLIPRGVAYSRPPMASEEKNNDSGLARLGLKLSDWFEKWFPDAFALALAAVAVVFVATLFAGASPLDSAQRFGAGFWDLITFTLQMSMIVVTGYAVATA